MMLFHTFLIVPYIEKEVHSTDRKPTNQLVTSSPITIPRAWQRLRRRPPCMRPLSNGVNEFGDLRLEGIDVLLEAWEKEELTS